jgi:hypothetical protein
VPPWNADAMAPINGCSGQLSALQNIGDGERNCRISRAFGSHGNRHC